MQRAFHFKSSLANGEVQSGGKRDENESVLERGVGCRSETRSSSERERGNAALAKFVHR